MKFTDVEFMTAKDKELVLKAWKTFLKHGFKYEHFTDRLYKHLINHASFIAHFNLMGFHETYFSSGDMKIKFMSQFDRKRGCQSVEYGGGYWLNAADYADINNAMVDAAEGYIPKRTWTGYLLVPALVVRGIEADLGVDAMARLKADPAVAAKLKEEGFMRLFVQDDSEGG